MAQQFVGARVAQLAKLSRAGLPDGFFSNQKSQFG
jgi:hypothetical protein